jgi:hypothetical protein
MTLRRENSEFTRTRENRLQRRRSNHAMTGEIKIAIQFFGQGRLLFQTFE